MILGIDTSAGQCAVALFASDGRVWQRAEPMDRGHAEALFPMIDAVLSDAGVALGDLARIAVCTGPGSFTGVRIGVAAARGLALGCGIPAVGITRFEALASGPGPVALPGRSGQIFVQDFGPDGPDGRHTPLGPPRIETGTAPDRMADPAIIARLGAAHPADLRPAPLYMRPADAAPARDQPPPRIA